MKSTLPSEYLGDGITSMRAALAALDSSHVNIHIALEQMTRDFLERAKDERKARRTRILNENRNGPKVRFSSNILVRHSTPTSVHLRWTGVWYPPLTSPTQKAQPRYNNIPSPRGNPDMRNVLKGAHPDEVDLLMEHEHHARALREAWKRLNTIRKLSRGFSTHAIGE